jgi:hypothetical protein
MGSKTALSEIVFNISDAKGNILIEHKVTDNVAKPSGTTVCVNKPGAAHSHHDQGSQLETHVICSLFLSRTPVTNDDQFTQRSFQGVNKPSAAHSHYDQGPQSPENHICSLFLSRTPITSDDQFTQQSFQGT